MPHNIDLHGVIGPGGGAASSFTAPVGMHIGNGTYGLMLVEPPGRPSEVDHEYYVMQDALS